MASSGHTFGSEVLLLISEHAYIGFSFIISFNLYLILLGWLQCCDGCLAPEASEFVDWCLRTDLPP